MTEITVVARIKARPDTLEAVRNGLLAMVEPTRREPGCMEYRLHQDSDDQATFVFYETWKNAAALERHKETAHYRHYAATVLGLVEAREVNRMSRIA